MKKVSLGNTDSKVSQLSLGCMYFGSKTDKKIAYNLLDQYIDAGGNFLDTANCYAFWIKDSIGIESETLLGNWMNDRQNRADIFIATKVGANMKDINKVKDPDGNLVSNYEDFREGLSKKTIIDAIDKSLKRLKTDYIDLYYAHIDDINTPLEETLEAFNYLVDEGKIRYIGCSNYRTWRLERAKNISKTNGWAEYCCIQKLHTYLRPVPRAKSIYNKNSVRFTDDELLDYCIRNEDVSLLAYSPTLLGLYNNKERRSDKKNWLWNDYSSPDTEARLKAIEIVAEELDITPIQVLFAWMQQNNPMAIPLIAASNEEQLKENLESAKIDLSKEKIKYLNNVSS
ncbi:MAG: aldo/keto reductase [Candidatus Lokiarchaeota archaeon]|nr:aldo/keto reductase [Candidatus Lokiarchaeota archaeon]